MKLTELLLQELDREAPGIRKALERVRKERTLETAREIHAGSAHWLRWSLPCRGGSTWL